MFQHQIAKTTKVKNFELCVRLLRSFTQALTSTSRLISLQACVETSVCVVHKRLPNTRVYEYVCTSLCVCACDRACVSVCCVFVFVWVRAYVRVRAYVCTCVHLVYAKKNGFRTDFYSMVLISFTLLRSVWLNEKGYQVFK